MTYRVQSLDTTEEAERIQLEILRRKGEAGRSHLMRSLTRSSRWLSWNNLLQLRPEFDRVKAFFTFIELTYGNELAHEVEREFSARKLDRAALEERIMVSEELLEAITPVIDAFDELNIPYLIGGSVASSTHGIARSTADADLVADFKPEHVSPFINRLQEDYYVSEIAIQQALSRHASFNLIHLATGLKVDVFVLKTDPFNQAGFNRARPAQLNKASPRLFRIDSPEDVLLQKLKWYRAGGEVSERQWLDVLGILKLQAGNLDRAYLRDWANQLALSDLLDRALEEAGLGS